MITEAGLFGFGLPELALVTGRSVRSSGRVSLWVPLRPCAFRRRSETLQPLWGCATGLRQLRVLVFPVTRGDAAVQA